MEGTASSLHSTFQNPCSLVDTSQPCPRDHEESGCTGHHGRNSSPFFSHSPPWPKHKPAGRHAGCTHKGKRMNSGVKRPVESPWASLLSCLKGCRRIKHLVSQNRTESLRVLLDVQLILKIVLHSYLVKGPLHHASTCLLSCLTFLYHYSRFSTFENFCFQKKKVLACRTGELHRSPYS